MLLTLKVSQLATIDQLEIDFREGLTVLTGETGAGKSIIIDAVNLLLGERTDTSMIRSGSDSASVEASFDMQQVPAGREILEEIGIPCDGELLVRGVLQSNGRKKLFLNDVRVTRAKLLDVGKCLIHVHGQHDNQALLQSQSHVHFLDGFGNTTKLCQKFLQQHQDYQRGIKQQKQLQEQLGERNQRLEYLLFQQSEIEEAQLDESEESALAEEGRLLGNAEVRGQLLNHVQQLLHEGDQPLIEHCEQLRRLLQDVVKVDSSCAEWLSMLEQAQIQLGELHYATSQYLQKIEANPQRLEWINQRLQTIQNLKRKYGVSIPDILKHHQQLQEEIQQLQDLEKVSQNLESQLKVIAEKRDAIAEKLSKKRQDAAKRFDQRVIQELKDMGMEKVQFQTNVVKQTDADGQPRYSNTGWDHVEFLLSVNPGQALQSLAKVASGGELSRVMLALKTVLAELDQTPTLIFDEIDTGISGRVAETVGLKLQQLGKSFQVLCITHLAQMASFAQNHFMISKEFQGQQTYTSVRELSFQERAAEIARLMGGATITEKTINLATEMLQNTQEESA